MAWTVPRTWNPGETVTAALMNIHVRDNLNILKTRILDSGELDFSQLNFLTALGLGKLIFSRVTSDFTKNNDTTLANVSGLSFALSASEVWAFLFIMKGLTTTTANWKLAVTAPTSPTAIWYGHDRVTNIGIGATATAGTALPREGVTASPGTEEMLLVHGLIRNGANAGSVQLQAAQNTAQVFDTKIRAESFVVALKVG
jgi:hypothetical protein